MSGPSKDTYLPSGPPIPKPGRRNIYSRDTSHPTSHIAWKVDIQKPGARVNRQRAACRMIFTRCRVSGSQMNLPVCWILKHFRVI
jgi:hypothetical protein